ncbi:acyl-CoA carboxylase subunit beta [Salinirussus salinus]|uniref:acyl-CoA carboxylase subunit beta n=1 Tax=Salinirussus salinus TaxID=1198300 RepID=UPI0013573C5E|nr:carboxyl transferase domain-containing protein [Salinirussus salinus]
MTKDSTHPKIEDRRELDTDALLERVQAAKRDITDEARPKQVKKQHENGKLTARERLEYLFDGGTYMEFGQLAAPHPATPEIHDWEREDAPADGVVTGIGDVDGRPVGAGAMDFTVKGGSLGHTGAYKIRRIAELASRRGFPFVLLHDSGGHRIQEGLDARPYAYGDPTGPTGIFTLQSKLSGWVPQISAMMGPGFAASTNYAATSDFVPMVEGTSTMGVAGPALVEAALGVDLTKEEIGGARFQTVETGMADRMLEDDKACLDAIKTFLSYFPSNANEQPPVQSTYTAPTEEERENLLETIPTNTKKGYDIYEIVAGIIDRKSFFELKPEYARNIVTGFARLEGQPVGVLANNPRIMSGTFDVPACDKAAHFISMCDAFDLPLVFLMDAPGVLPGPDSERQGIARHSGKVLFEVNRATVPKLSIALRRGYGFGYVLMAGGRSTYNDLTAVWPTAEIAAMGIEGAVDIAYRREVEAADDPEQKREELIQKFINRTGAIRAVEHFGVDAALDPRNTRDWLLQALRYSKADYSETWPPKKHDINPI